MIKYYITLKFLLRIIRPSYIHSWYTSINDNISVFWLY